VIVVVVVDDSAKWTIGAQNVESNFFKMPCVVVVVVVVESKCGCGCGCG